MRRAREGLTRSRLEGVLHSHHAMLANLQDIVEKMAEVTGRDVEWSTGQAANEGGFLIRLAAATWRNTFGWLFHKIITKMKHMSYPKC